MPWRHSSRLRRTFEAAVAAALAVLPALLTPMPATGQTRPPVNSPQQGPPTGAISARPEDYRVVIGEPLVSRSNSYTQAQVEERLRAAGFTAIRDVRKDDDGIWRGSAELNGQAVEFGVDYRGSIAAR
jgi:protein CpxP